MKRNRNKPTETLTERLQKFADDAREAARRLAAGKERDELLRKAEQAETALALIASQTISGLQRDENSQ